VKEVVAAVLLVSDDDSPCLILNEEDIGGLSIEEIRKESFRSIVIRNAIKEDIIMSAVDRDRFNQSMNNDRA
jgi:hypothetical protein